MKKVITLLVSIAVMLFIVGCGPTTNDNPSSNAGQDTASKSSETQQPAASEKYKVSIDNFTLVKDYEGKDAIIVDYTFTNLSEKDTSFMVAVSDKAFQNGVELETAIIMDNKAFDSSASMKDIKKGATLKVQQAFILSDKSDVTIEVKELFSFNDAKIAEKVFKIA